MAISFNPLKCGGTELPPNLLLPAKLIALALLLANHVRILPRPSTLRLVLQTVFVVSALAILFNFAPRLGSLALGGCLLLSVAASKAYYGNTQAMCGALLLLIGLYHKRFGTWFPRTQIALARFARFFSWPKEMIVIYDGDCGICTRLRHWLEKVDFENAFAWKTLQSGAGVRWNIPRAALEDRLHLVVDGKIHAGFRACKMILLYNPACYLLCCALIAAPPGAAVWYRRIVVGSLLCFFFPLFNPIGEAAYNWVARNRYRISGDGPCVVEPSDKATSAPH